MYLFIHSVFIVDLQFISSLLIVLIHSLLCILISQMGWCDEVMKFLQLGEICSRGVLPFQ